MSEAIVDILTYHNYQVDAVYDGADALAYAQVEQYDGIILDVMMPQKNGFEVLEQLRREGHRTPVLLLTAKAEIEDRIMGLDLGADDYLPMPVEKNKFAGKPMMASIFPSSSSFFLIFSSAPPRNRTPCGKIIAIVPSSLKKWNPCNKKAKSAAAFGASP